MQEATQNDVDELVETAREAGAEPEFIAVLIADQPGDADHLIRDLVRRSDGSGDLLLNRIDTAGHLVQALFGGDLAEALYRADIARTRLLLRAFSREEMLAALALERGGIESARRWLDPNIERYGADE